MKDHKEIIDKKYESARAAINHKDKVLQKIVSPVDDILSLFDQVTIQEQAVAKLTEELKTATEGLEYRTKQVTQLKRYITGKAGGGDAKDDDKDEDDEDGEMKMFQKDPMNKLGEIFRFLP
eukprot:UN00258